MNQYCRYCTHLHVNNCPYCDVKKKTIKESSCKRVNNCSDFEFANCEPEYQDAFGETKGYKPRKKRIVNKDNNQITFDEYISKMKGK